MVRHKSRPEIVKPDAKIRFIGLLLTLSFFAIVMATASGAGVTSVGTVINPTVSEQVAVSDVNPLLQQQFDERGIPKLRSTTSEQRKAAADAAAEQGLVPAMSGGAPSGELGVAAVPGPGGPPDYFGPYPNYANSPIPVLDVTGSNVTPNTGIRKFVDSLPGLGLANNLGKYIPVAVKDTISYPGSDYYRIALVEYTEQMHSDLPPTTLRGYVQLETPNMTAGSKHIPLSYPNNTPILENGNQVYAFDVPHYLGPSIIAQKDVPVRVKFTNYLPNMGSGGELFLPVDPTVMGAGEGPLGTGAGNYTENRATLHLHGGATPWISDGTPHQWTAPVGENTPYLKGASVQYVPDMDGGTEPPGTLSFFYTNNQSARLLWYHDHAYGITRLNVYAGEAAPYVIQDPVEQSLVSGSVLPSDQIPLVIQDKAFLDNTTVAAQDPTWNWGTNSTGDLWFPHVYMPNQNPYNMMGANAMGRWDYGPWFWPPFTGLVNGIIPNVYYDPVNAPWEPQFVPGTPNPTIVPEAFVDTMLVNGNAYPYLEVAPKAYRFTILNACNDRYLNLQIYYAAPLYVSVTNGGTNYTSAPNVTFSGGGGTGANATAVIAGSSITNVTVNNGGTGYTSASVTFTGGGGGGALATPILSNGTITGINVTKGGSGYTSAPLVVISGTGTGANATAVIGGGPVVGVTVTSPGTGYTTPPLVTISGGGGTGATAIASLNTEVPMVPAVPNAGLPATWPTDGRDGGVPDPNAAGPSWIQFGSEGGFLPNVTVIPPTPIGYDYNRRVITVLNVLDHALYLGPAERADTVVDFSGIPDGTRLIVYNDAPAPDPAFDTRNDYYTDDPNQTSTGGAPTTLPGYGPNTRTVMQVRVNYSLGADPGPYNLAGLQSALPPAYAQLQNPPIVPQARYDAPFNATYPADAFARIQDTSMSFFNGAVGGLQLTNGGTNYVTVPNVTITGGGGTGATGTATLSPISVASLNLTSGGSGYNTVPNVTITGGGGTGANATATLATAGAVDTVTVTRGGSGYTSRPRVIFTGGGGTNATARANIQNGRVVSVTVTNGGSGYTSAPAVSFSGGGGSGARARATIGFAVTSLTLTNGGTGYSSAPAVNFIGGGGTGASATATLSPASVASLVLLTGGSGYTQAPLVNISGGGGTGATGIALMTGNLTMDLQPKSIIEDFEVTYGRMNAMLGVEVPRTNLNIQTSIPYYDIDPPTEIFTAMNFTDAGMTPIGSLGDGTQLWKITHNGVDTHAIHWHMFNVQLINRVGWDGMIKPPDDNEIGWKDTIKMNPLEDVIVAMRPVVPDLPWDLPNSIRSLDVTMPDGMAMPLQFHNIDPTNEPATVINHQVNFGWEYMWHCHLLGHEENIMMRPISFAAQPAAPTNLLATPAGTSANPRVRVTWTDASTDETNWTVQRSGTATGPWTNITSFVSTTGPGTGSTITYTDRTVVSGRKYFYRVFGVNIVGDTTVYAAPAVGYPNVEVDSDPSNVDPATAP